MKYQNELDAYYTQANNSLLSMIPNGPNVVMDLGCAAGRLGKKLLEIKKASELIGVEIYEPAAVEAKKIYNKIHVGNIEEINLDYKNYFDVVICGDILEHLKEPYDILKEIHNWLKEGGIIICCVPNVRYWEIWIDLVLRGRWEYVSKGILDKTHLRFFTTRSFKKMLIDASFIIDYVDMRISTGIKQRIFNRITFGLFKEFLGVQMLISARKTRDNAKVI